MNGVRILSLFLNEYLIIIILITLLAVLLVVVVLLVLSFPLLLCNRMAYTRENYITGCPPSANYVHLILRPCSIDCVSRPKCARTQNKPSSRRGLRWRITVQRCAMERERPRNAEHSASCKRAWRVGSRGRSRSGWKTRGREWGTYSPRLRLRPFACTHTHTQRQRYQGDGYLWHDTRRLQQHSAARRRGGPASPQRTEKSLGG